jgi:hypothetical protein
MVATFGDFERPPPRVRAQLLTKIRRSSILLKFVCPTPVCHILGRRYLASLLRSVVKSETSETTTVDRVILADEQADLA